MKRYIQLFTNEERSKFNKALYYMSPRNTIFETFLYTYIVYASRSPYLVSYNRKIQRLKRVRVIGYFSHDYALDGKPFGFLTCRAIS